MALTVSQTPKLYTPAYNEQFFTALSDQIAVTDFKYIVTVECNASGVVETYDILQRPDGYLVYDVQEWTKNYISRSYFNPKLYQSGSYGLATGKAATVQVKIKEYYSGAIQSTYTYDYTIWDACLKKEDFATFDYTAYVINGTDIIPLSDDPNPYPYINTESGDYFIHFFRNNSTKVTLTTLDDTSGIVDSVDIALNTSNNLIHYFDCGYNSLVTLGMTPPLDGWSVVVEIKNGSTVLYTTQLYFKDIETDYVDYGVFYLTREGKINYMDFEKVSQKTVDKQVNTVRQRPNKITSGVYGSNIYDSELYTVSTQTTKQILLNANWITPSQAEKLEDLFDSPVVYLKDYKKNRYLSVRVKNSNYEIGNGFIDPLIPFSITCEYSIQETRQRGL